MAPHNPTTGLFQGDGGWFRAGAEDFMTQEVLVEGAMRELTESIRPGHSVDLPWRRSVETRG